MKPPTPATRFAFLLALVLIGTATAARAATVDQYGNIHRTDIDMIASNYESARAQWGSPYQAPNVTIDRALIDRYEKWKNADRAKFDAEMATVRQRNEDVLARQRASRARESAQVSDANARTSAAGRLAAAYTVAKLSGDESACVAVSLAMLNRLSSKDDSWWPGLPSDPCDPLVSIRTGRGAELGWVWSAALGSLLGLERIDYIDLGEFNRPSPSPSGAMNRALGFFLEVNATPLGKAATTDATRAHRAIAADALHSLATAGANRDASLVLDPSVAALVRRLQRDAAPLALSAEAAQLVERTLRAGGGNALDPHWIRLAGPAPAPGAGTSAAPPTPIDPRALPALGRSLVPSASHLNRFLLSLRADAAPRPPWLDDPATAKTFRGLVEGNLASLRTQLDPQADSFERNLPDAAGLNLNLVLNPPPRLAEKLAAWETHLGEFSRDPRALAPQIIVDAMEGSAEAFLVHELAYQQITGDFPPAEKSWPALDQLARHPRASSMKPGERITAAWGMIAHQGGRPFAPAEKKLLEKLLGTRPDPALTELQRVNRLSLLALAGYDADRLQAEAIGAARAKLSSPHAAQLFQIVYGTRIPHLLALKQPTAAEIDATLRELLDDTRAYEAIHHKGFLPPERHHAAIAALIDRRRQLDGRYPEHERSKKIADFRLPAPNAPDFDEGLKWLHRAAWDEIQESSFNHVGLDRLAQVLIASGASKEASYAYQHVLNARHPRWWASAPNFDNSAQGNFPGTRPDPRLHLRIALRQRAEELAATLVQMRHEPDRKSLNLEDVRRLAVDSAARPPAPAAQLLGRDLALGGLGTRALLELLARHRTADELTDSSSAPFTAWFASLAHQPAALPATTIIDRLAAVALNDGVDLPCRRAAALGLAAATEAVFHDDADSIGSLAWRRHALALLARHADKLPLDTDDWPDALKPHAGKFLSARVAWELSRLDAPALPPAERAAPLVKNLGPLAAALAFLARTDLAVNPDLPNSTPRQILLEPDSAFSPALLRAASALPDQEPLIARYLDSSAPRVASDWLVLAAGRIWPASKP
ncbi:MAG: hypothetical protein RLZZ15_2414 [Verrucomicrobiota bacterium]|jgi:hypothetical protein